MRGGGILGEHAVEGERAKAPAESGEEAAAGEFF
jgi:hypothetical protein